jgi:hypothetical protein
MYVLMKEEYVTVNATNLAGCARLLIALTLLILICHTFPFVRKLCSLYSITCVSKQYRHSCNRRIECVCVWQKLQILQHRRGFLRLTVSALRKTVFCAVYVAGLNICFANLNAANYSTERFAGPVASSLLCLVPIPLTAVSSPYYTI